VHLLFAVTEVLHKHHKASQGTQTTYSCMLCCVVQALMSVRLDMPGKQLWQQRIEGIHATWGGKDLTTRDNDITPGACKMYIQVTYNHFEFVIYMFT
jgi:hypothetical protein